MVPNHATHHKCEIAGLGILKGAKEAVFGLQNIDLVNDTIKILGIHFAYDKKIQGERDYLTTVKKNSKGSHSMDYKDTYSRRKKFNF